MTPEDILEDLRAVVRDAERCCATEARPERRSTKVRDRVAGRLMPAGASGRGASMPASARAAYPRQTPTCTRILAGDRRRRRLGYLIGRRPEGLKKWTTAWTVPPTRKHRGVSSSLRSLVDRVLAVPQTRGELLSTELEEEVTRLVGEVVWSFAGVFAAIVGLVRGRGHPACGRRTGACRWR
ncbi:MAG: hypothetical protein IPO18_09335 [bacterium]|nr:hypothetical protein [bacterium]